MCIRDRNGNESINEFLLKNYGNLFNREFVNGEKKFENFLFSGGMIDFMAFNRLMPSNEKSNILKSLFSLSSDCLPELAGQEISADLVVSQYLILNYEEFYSKNEYVLDFSKSNFKNDILENRKKGLPDCHFITRHALKTFSYVLNNQNKLTLVSKNNWRNRALPEYYFF